MGGARAQDAHPDGGDCVCGGVGVLLLLPAVPGDRAVAPLARAARPPLPSRGLGLAPRHPPPRRLVPPPRPQPAQELELETMVIRRYAKILQSHLRHY